MVVEKIERQIQYFGLLRPPSDKKNIKWWRLTADIVRPHLSEYRNDKYPVPQGFWGYVQAMTEERVLHTYRISYKNEIVAFNIDTDLFLQQNISCSLEAVLTSFINLGVLVGGVPFQRNNPIKDWRNLSFPIDEFKIRLLTQDVVFKFTYEYEVQENCSVPLSEEPPQPPPPPSFPPVTPFPPGTLDIDIPPNAPAYDPNTNDGGETYKPGEPEEPPPPTLCEPVTVNWRVTNPSLIGQVPSIITGEFNASTEIGNIFVRPGATGGGFEVGVLVGGLVDGVCSQNQETVFFSGGNDGVFGEIVSVQPRP